MAKRKDTGNIKVAVVAASVAGFFATFLWVAQQPTAEQAAPATVVNAATTLPATQQVVPRTLPATQRLVPAPQPVRRAVPVTRSRAS